METESAVNNGAEALKSKADELRRRGQEIGDRLTAAWEHTKENTLRYRGKAVEGAKVTDKTIRDHPYPSIGIAFALGLLIGVLANRR